MSKPKEYPKMTGPTDAEIQDRNRSLLESAMARSQGYTPEQRKRAMARVSKVIERLSAPPESILDHLHRIGVPYKVRSLAESGAGEGPTRYVMINAYRLEQAEAAQLHEHKKKLEEI